MYKTSYQKFISSTFRKVAIHYFVIPNNLHCSSMRARRTYVCVWVYIWLRFRGCPSLRWSNLGPTKIPADWIAASYYDYVNNNIVWTVCKNCRYKQQYNLLLSVYLTFYDSKTGWMVFGFSINDGARNTLKSW